MKRQIARSIAVFLFAFLLAGAAHAQMAVSASAGVVQYTQGSVFLDDHPLQLPQSGSIQMKEGQSLQTKQGYAELLLAPNMYLRLGENSSLRLECGRIDDVRLELQHGSAVIETLEEIRGNQAKVRISASAVEIKNAGLYRLDPESHELRVYGGSALAISGSQKLQVKNGSMVHLDSKLVAAKFNANAADPLHKWAAERSFNLFISSPAARGKRMGWMPISLGWLYSNHYRMRFFSKQYQLEEQASKESAQAEALAKSKALMDAMTAEAQRAAAEIQARSMHSIQDGSTKANSSNKK